MSRLCRIVYCSRSLLKGSRSDIEAQIRQIVATARARNPEAGLRGALTFNEGCFAQVLEGDDDDLAPVYEKIRRDPRHTDVKILVQDNPTRRLFSSWSMAYVGTESGHWRQPVADFSSEAALTQGAAPEAQLFLEALRQVVVAKTKLARAKSGADGLPAEHPMTPVAVTDTAAAWARWPQVAGE